MNSQNLNRNGLLIHGKEAYFLIEKIIREQIFDSIFWKEHLYAADLYTLIEHFVKNCNYLGGTFSTSKPVPFLCYLLKLLQIQPANEIIFEILKYRQFKYLTCLCLFYLRLTSNSQDVYLILEPFMNEYLKLRIRKEDGSFGVIYMDEYIDELLTQERVFGIILPRLTKRRLIESNMMLEPKVSIIEYELEELLSTQISEEEHSQDKTRYAEGKLSFKKKNANMEQSEDPSVAIVEAKRIEKEKINESLSLEATNDLRAKLGLKPLKRH